MGRFGPAQFSSDVELDREAKRLRRDESPAERHGRDYAPPTPDGDRGEVDPSANSQGYGSDASRLYDVASPSALHTTAEDLAGATRIARYAGRMLGGGPGGGTNYGSSSFGGGRFGGGSGGADSYIRQITGTGNTMGPPPAPTTLQSVRGGLNSGLGVRGGAMIAQAGLESLAHTTGALAAEDQAAHGASGSDSGDNASAYLAAQNEEYSGAVGGIRHALHGNDKDTAYLQSAIQQEADATTAQDKAKRAAPIIARAQQEQRDQAAEAAEKLAETNAGSTDQREQLRAKFEQAKGTEKIDEQFDAEEQAMRSSDYRQSSPQFLKKIAKVEDQRKAAQAQAAALTGASDQKRTEERDERVAGVESEGKADQLETAGDLAGAERERNEQKIRRESQEAHKRSAEEGQAYDQDVAPAERLAFEQKTNDRRVADEQQSQDRITESSDRANVARARAAADAADDEQDQRGASLDVQTGQVKQAADQQTATVAQGSDDQQAAATPPPFTTIPAEGGPAAGLAAAQARQPGSPAADAFPSPPEWLQAAGGIAGGIAGGRAQPPAGQDTPSDSPGAMVNRLAGAAADATRAAADRPVGGVAAAPASGQDQTLANRIPPQQVAGAVPRDVGRAVASAIKDTGAGVPTGTGTPAVAGGNGLGLPPVLMPVPTPPPPLEPTPDRRPPGSADDRARQADRAVYDAERAEKFRALEAPAQRTERQATAERDNVKRDQLQRQATAERGEATAEEQAYDADHTHGDRQDARQERAGTAAAHLRAAGLGPEAEEAQEVARDEDEARKADRAGRPEDAKAIRGREVEQKQEGEFRQDQQQHGRDRREEDAGYRAKGQGRMADYNDFRDRESDDIREAERTGDPKRVAQAKRTAALELEQYRQEHQEKTRVMSSEDYFSGLLTGSAGDNGSAAALARAGQDVKSLDGGRGNLKPGDASSQKLDVDSKEFGKATSQFKKLLDGATHIAVLK